MGDHPANRKGGPTGLSRAVSFPAGLEPRVPAPATMSMTDSQPTIAAIATAPGRGGIGIVRLSGAATPQIALRMLGRLPSPRRAVYRAFVRSRLGLDLKDTNCPFKLIRNNVLEGQQFQSNGFAIDAEIMSAIVNKGIDIVEIPVSHSTRQAGMSSVGLGSIILTIVEVMRAGRPEE